MSLSNTDKGELVFKEIQHSYTFWSIKKAVKDELIKSQNNNKSMDIAESMPKILKDLNLETTIKNKVHELLDKNGYFRDSTQIATTKFKNCKNVSKLPQQFFDKEDYEPLESVAQAKKQWSEHLKMRLSSFVRQNRKPWIRVKKIVPVKKLKQVMSEDVDPENNDPDAQPVMLKEPSYQIGGGSAPAGFENQFIYDWKGLLETCAKLESPNFSGNPHMNWGLIKV